MCVSDLEDYLERERDRGGGRCTDKPIICFIDQAAEQSIDKCPDQ